MRTWFDFMDAHYAPEVPAQPDDGAAARIGALVEGRLARKEARARRPGRLRLALLAAAVLACCVGGAALAQGAFPWAGAFGAYFGKGAQQQAAALGMPGEGLGLSKTSGGVTVTLEGILDDGEKAYIPVTLTFEDGTAPDAGLRYIANSGLWPADPPEGYSSSGGCHMLPDDDPEDNQVRLMCTSTHAGLRPGETVTMNFRRLYATSADEDGTTSVAWQQDGQWIFSFALPEAQPAVTVDVPAGTADPETGAQIAQVRLTPMGVRVVFDGLSESTQERDAISRARIVLHLEDGTTRTMADWGEAAGRAAGGAQAGGPIGRPYYEVSCDYGGFIDPAQVTAVEVGGATIPIA